MTLLIALMLCYQFGLPWPFWLASFVVYGLSWWVRMKHYQMPYVDPAVLRQDLKDILDAINAKK